ncbi:hypothetical protein AGR4B_pAt20403 [Agrobacterium tumefaciens str. CFBP 5621]|nr:hypothetical protein AGR4B_pAt20403 [Agrobacterium tumefaciens str. CFBP 5621]
MSLIMTLARDGTQVRATDYIEDGRFPYHPSCLRREHFGATCRMPLTGRLSRMRSIVLRGCSSLVPLCMIVRCHPACQLE